ncbi:MAG: class I SAM-dependent methyltransferase [Solirubrobacterales bacterium]
MTGPTYDRDFWEKLWARTLSESPERVAARGPSAHLTAVAGSLPPGVALDAGCGHGSETLWLAARGWRVTAVDFSTAALTRGQALAAAAGPEIAERIEWVEADLGTWAPSAGGYDLVASLYVHIAGSVGAMVRRMATAVAPGGTLLLVGHRPVDPATGAPTPAAGQTQVSVEAATAALDPSRWEPLVAEDRARATIGTGVDAVICARSMVRRAD